MSLSFFRKKSSFGFTLTELIVVITILAILSIVGFLSFSSYSSSARDAARTSDIENIVKSLELFSLASDGVYPEPSNPFDVTYSGSIVWTQGTFGESMVTNLGKVAPNKKAVDPKYKTEFSYSKLKSKIKGAYQVSGIFESGRDISYIPLNFVETTYASSEETAYVQGNYNGKITKVQSGSTSLALTIPSIILRSTGSISLMSGTPINTFVLNQQSNLPPTYQNTGSGFYFSPTVVAPGADCSINTDSGMIDFAKSIKNIYNRTPFTSLSDYEDILSASSDYDLAQVGYRYLKDAMKCSNTPEPKIQRDAEAVSITPPSPMGCDGEDLDFESYASGATVAGGCLFNEVGSATGWLVTTSSASNGLKSLRSPTIFQTSASSATGSLFYSANLSSPAKIQFSYKYNVDYDTSFRFYIDGTLMISHSSSVQTQYVTYVSHLLPAGSHTFEWRIKKGSYRMNMNIDNIGFSCIGGGSGCGWDLGFEEGGNLIPNTSSSFSFVDTSGGTGAVWPRDPVGAVQGSYTIRSPYSIGNGSNGTGSMYYTIHLTEPARLKFLYKVEANYGAYYTLFIDGFMVDRKVSATVPYRQYASSLLSPGTHNIEWRVRATGGYGVSLWLDDIGIDCEGGGSGCGWDSGFEDGNEFPNAGESITFTGSWGNPWVRDYLSSNVASGSYSLRSPILLGSYPGKAMSGSLVYKKNISTPTSFSFSYKADIAYDTYYNFYIDDVLAESRDSTKSMTGFSLYTTPVLAIGNHTFEWKVRTNWGNSISLWLDNFLFSP